MINSNNNLFQNIILGKESPSMSHSGGSDRHAGSMNDSSLPNEISAPYELPQFPIEQIEKKLQIQKKIK